jgi:hypothetical protein
VYASFLGVSSRKGPLRPTPSGRYPVSGASHLDLFEQPVKKEFFRKLLNLPASWQIPFAEFIPKGK